MLENANILNNCYGYTIGAGNKLKYAVSNRFYDGIIYHIPQLVEPNGYKTEWAEKAGLGVAYFPDDGFADKLYKYYQSINADEFDNACQNEIKRVINEDDTYIRMIDRFINS